MPLISTNDNNLHQKLKLYAVQKGITIGNLVEIFTKFGLSANLDDLSPEQLDKLEIEVQKVKGQRN